MIQYNYRIYFEKDIMELRLKCKSVEKSKVRINSIRFKMRVCLLYGRARG